MYSSIHFVTKNDTKCKHLNGAKGEKVANQGRFCAKFIPNSNKVHSELIRFKYPLIFIRKKLRNFTI